MYYDKTFKSSQSRPYRSGFSNAMMTLNRASYIREPDLCNSIHVCMFVYFHSQVCVCVCVCVTVGL